MAETIAVIGGGITGLVAALDLSSAGHEVHVYEARASLGGKIAEIELDGKTIPTGPDAFLARRPELFELARELGLESEIITPSAGSARIFRDGRLHPIPPSVLGIPATADLAESGLLSLAGAERAARDIDAPDDRPEGDESVGALVRRRLGDEVMDYLVDPLLGGINAGNADLLSVASGAPQIDALRKKNRSLITAAAETLAAASPNAGPVFSSIRGGLNRMIDRLATVLDERPHAHMHLGVLATISREGDRWLVDDLHVDRVVLTTPAWVAAELLQEHVPTAAAELAKIDYSSVGFAVLVLPPDTIDIDSSISGVLVPRASGLMVTAASFASHKWPELSNAGEQILRVSVGRRDDLRWREHSGEELLEQIRLDLSTIFDAPIPVGPRKLTTWTQSLPQYDVGHADRIARIDAAMASAPTLLLTGAWRSGLGLPACVAAGREAAKKLV